MTFQVLIVTGMKMAVFWDVVPYSLADTQQRFRGAHCPHHKGDELAGALPYVCVHVPSDYTSTQIIYYTRYKKVAPHRYVQFDVPSNHYESWMISYTHHRNMDALHYVSVYVQSS
jgi:hypothetical protein